MANIFRRLGDRLKTPIDGGLADNNLNKLVLPSNTTENLAEITPEVASIAFDTSLGEVVINDGTGFSPVSAGSGANTSLSNLSSVAVNTTLDVNGNDVLNVNNLGVNFIHQAGGSTNLIDLEDGQLSLNDLSGLQAIAWNDRVGVDVTGSFVTLDWGNLILKDNTNTLSMDWNNRLLYDSSNSTVMDWNASQLISGTAAVDWGLRQLRFNTSNLVAVDFSTAGAMKFQNANEGTAGYVWTSTDTQGSGHWAPGVAGANVTLSNLTSPTSVNQSLIPNTDSSHDLGASGKAWNNIWVNNIETAAGAPANAIQILVGQSNGADGSAVNIFSGLGHGLVNGGPINITAGNTTASAGKTGGAINITAGSAQAGGTTSNGGSIILAPGTSVGTGSAGVIQLNDQSGTITAGQVWTATDTTGSGHWASSSGGANTALSNLTSPTAINQPLNDSSGLSSLDLTTRILTDETGEEAATWTSTNRSLFNSSTQVMVDFTGPNLKFQNANEGTAGYVWMSTDTVGSGHWAPTPTVTGSNNTVAFFNGGGALSSSTTFGWDGTTLSPQGVSLTGTNFNISGGSSSGGGSTAGSLSLSGGTNSSSGTGGDINVSGGNSGSGSTAAGNIILTSGENTFNTAIRGNIKFKNGSEGTAGSVWTSTDTQGSGHWVAGASGTFLTADAKTVTVTNGVITSIV